MSEIPEDNRTIVRELLGWKWSDDYNRENTLEAISRAFNEREDLERFINRMVEYYYDLERKQGYRPSWRGYRESSIASSFKREFDFDEIRSLCEEELEEVRQENQEEE